MRLNDQEISNLIIDASKEGDMIETDGLLYLRSISYMARKRGLIRTLECYPHSHILRHRLLYRD